MKKQPPLKKIDISKLTKVMTPQEKRDSLQKVNMSGIKAKKTGLKKNRSKLQVKKDNPNSNYWKKKADKAWGAFQHHHFRHCIVGSIEPGTCSGPLNQHHLISRGNVFLRHEIENCASLCVWHHLYSTTCSPHGGPLGFASFLRDNYPVKHQWAIDNQHKTGKPNYRDSYETLTEWEK